MSAPFHDIETKGEEALAASIVANVTTVQLDGAEVLTMLAASDIESGTRIVCSCPRARGAKGLPGNYYLTMTAEVHTKVNPPSDRSTILAAHRSRTGYIRDLFQTDTFAAILSSNATDFGVQGVISEVQTESREEEDHFVSEITAEVLCGTSD